MKQNKKKHKNQIIKNESKKNDDDWNYEEKYIYKNASSFEVWKHVEKLEKQDEQKKKNMFSNSIIIIIFAIFPSKLKTIDASSKEIK